MTKNKKEDNEKETVIKEFKEEPKPEPKPEPKAKAPPKSQPPVRGV
tara:strand:+ start:14673 stop:14810 length:138 start_codon:yes stop_codon:yes gene_type:complete